MAKAKSSGRSSKAGPSSGGSHRLYDEAWGIAGTLFKSRRDLGAEKLQAIGEATRAYAKSLESIPIVGEQVNAVSEAVEDFSKYVSQADLENIGSDAIDYARRNPAATMGLALVLGVVATRYFIPTVQATRPRGNGKRSSVATKKSAAKSRSGNGSTHAQGGNNANAAG